MQDCRPCCGCGPRRFPKATQHRCTGLILNNKPGRRPPWFTTTFYGGAMLLDGFSRLLRTKNFGFMVGTSEMITSRGRSSCGCILDSPAWCAALCVASMWLGESKPRFHWMFFFAQLQWIRHKPINLEVVTRRMSVWNVFEIHHQLSRSRCICFNYPKPSGTIWGFAARELEISLQLSFRISGRFNLSVACQHLVESLEAYVLQVIEVE